MKLNLTSPLVFIDLETTGIDINQDRIVQLAILKVLPNGSEERKKVLLNPTIPIQPAASNMHGIYDEDVKQAPTFAQIATNLAEYIDDADFAGYNSNKFDIPLLIVEFLRVGIEFKLEGKKFIDVMTIFHKMEPRTLKAAYKLYCGKELVGAHDAENDIVATYEVLKAQLLRYENVAYEDKEGNISYPISNNVDTLADFTPFNLIDPTNKIISDEQGKVIFNFGQYKGQAVVDVLLEKPGYYHWMMEANFSIFTKKIITHVWEGVKRE
ncbi:putative DNA polymerase III epsilon chain [Calothrix sp. NIES-4071]|nr:putative DNA polymerase III epsilon chain [Calothrix sp. NIES-4071]BAZ62636.1 putative DNA polymerase III epsilon chain [Calothrix sp. NIES-4105]